MKKALKISAIAGLLFPVISFAQQLGGTHTLLNSIAELVRFGTIVVAGIALLVFFWGLVKFLFKGGEDIEEGRNLMIWGTVAIFVMVSIWGLVRFIQNELLPGGASSTIVAPPIPSFNR